MAQTVIQVRDVHKSFKKTEVLKGVNFAVNLEKFDLTEAANRRGQTYSGGMRRRLDIAMSLIGNPPVIFCALY
jgi:ABC-type multidrug transport system ATPase subunit